MSEIESVPDLLSNLAHEFAERYRRGERPALEEYTERHPELATQIRELFPALAMMEQFGSVAGEAPAGNAASAPVPRQLGEYRILREIGRGGMGVVYEAVQESLGRHVALKVLPLHHLMAATHLERFEREAKAAARLHHTNIVPVFGSGVHESVHYYAMQYIQGQAIDAVLDEVRRLRDGTPVPATATALTASIAQGLFTDVPPEPLAALHADSSNRSTGSSELTGPSEVQYFRGVARLGVQVAEALAYAHRQGIVHRDIKPSNLLLDTQGVAWITDFGLVKDESGSNLTSPGDVVGTIRYMAPERFEDQGDARCDIYGLGVTLYEMLTLRPAFGGDRRAELIDRVRRAEPPRPRQIAAHIPRDLETVVLKAMAKEPARRYPNAEPLAEDLRRFLADRPVLARRSTPLERTWRWCRRNPGMALLIGSVLLLLTALLTGAVAHNIRLQEQLERVERAEKEKSEQLERAEKAEREKTDKLWDAYLANARASRHSGQPGRRFDSLAAVRQAAALRPDLRLRNEAIALLTLADVRLFREIAEGRPQGTATHCFDADLQHYARSDLKGNISVRRVADDQEVKCLPGPGTHAYQMKFSPNGRFLSAYYHTNSAPQRIWDWRRERVVLESVSDQFSPDGAQVAFGRDGWVTFYDLDSGRVVRRLKVEPPKNQAHHCTFHPEGKLLAVTTPGLGIGTLRVLDLATGAVIHAATILNLGDVAWQPEQARLAVISGVQVQLWDTRTWTPHKVLSAPYVASRHACFSPRDDLLVSSGDGRLRLWDPATGKQQLSLHGALVDQFNRDGRYLAATQDGAALHIWEVAASREYRVLQTPPMPNHTTWMQAFSPDGALLATCGASGVRLWDVPAGRDVTLVPTGACSGVAFAPDGRSLFTRTADGVERWPLKKVPGPSSPSAPRAAEKGPHTVFELGPAEPVLALPFAGHTGTLVRAAEGKLAANVRDDGTVFLFDADQPDRATKLSEHPRSTNWLAASADGRWVATRSWWDLPDKVRVSDVQTGDVVFTHLMTNGGISFSPDSRWLVTGGDACRIWETGTWNARLIPSPPGLGNVMHAAFAPDGVMLAIAHENRAVRLVDARSGAEFATLPAPDLPAVNQLTFSPDGGRLACLVDEVGVQLWDLRGIRARLQEMNLDWERPAYPPFTAPGGPQIVRVRMNGRPPLPLRAPFAADEAREHQHAWAQHLGVPAEITNPIGMNLQLIPPGRYVAAKFPSERGASDKPFYIGANEVTVGQFRQFVRETKYKTTGEANGLGGRDDRTGRKPEQIWSLPKYAPSDRHPVVQVTWHDAMAFCDWLGRKHGATYRLPTLDEWRWAALAGTAHQFHFGDMDEALDEHYWHKGNSGQQSRAVGTKKANPWGLFDMYGNVWEHTYLWTRKDRFVDMATARAGPGAADKIHLAGGSFWDAPTRPDYLAHLNPPDIGYHHFGFRVVLVGDVQTAARAVR